MSAPRNSNNRRKGSGRKPGLSGESLIPHLRTDAVPQRPTGVKVGWPAQKRVRLLYADFLTQSGSAGSAELQQFRLNSLFDPDLTNVGHQPMAFDQWSLFYNHYCVTQASFEVEIFPSSSGSATTHGVWVTDSNSVAYTPAGIMEAGGDVRVLNVYSGVPDTVFRGTVDVAKFFRRPSDSMLSTDSELRALVTANPSEIVFLNIVSQSPSATSHTTYLRVRIEFECVFIEPKTITASLSGGPATSTLLTKACASVSSSTLNDACACKQCAAAGCAARP